MRGTYCELLALLLKLAYETNLLFSKERDNEVRVAVEGCSITVADPALGQRSPLPTLWEISLCFWAGKGCHSPETGVGSRRESGSP